MIDADGHTSREHSAARVAGHRLGPRNVHPQTIWEVIAEDGWVDYAFKPGWLSGVKGGRLVSLFRDPHSGNRARSHAVAFLRAQVAWIEGQMARESAKGTPADDEWMVGKREAAARYGAWAEAAEAALRAGQWAVVPTSVKA